MQILLLIWLSDRSVQIFHATRPLRVTAPDIRERESTRASIISRLFFHAHVMTPTWSRRGSAPCARASDSHGATSRYLYGRNLSPLVC